MENSNIGNSWSAKIGLFTGPLMILAGVFALKMSDKSPYLAYFIILMGIIRTGMSAFLFLKQKKNTEI